MIAVVSLPSAPQLLSPADDASQRGTAGAVGDERAEERALVERAQAGDRRAFRGLYDLHAKSVYRAVLMPLVRDTHLAEDLLADTFVRALERIDRFTWQGRGIGPWLMRIAKNLALDHLRKKGRMGAWPDGFEQSLPTPGETSAERLMGHAQLSDLLGDRIRIVQGELNPRYQRVLQLRMIDKVSRADAAAELEVSLGTLDVLLHRACKAFKKAYLARYGGSSPQEIFEP